MGGSVGGNFGNTKGSTKRISLPSNDSQLNHIFRERKGHLTDTPEHRQLIVDTANNTKNYVGRDSYDNSWFEKIQSDGSQIWVKTRDSIISDAGKNDTPREFDPESGLNNNPKKNNTWRKKK